MNVTEIVSDDPGIEGSVAVALREKPAADRYRREKERINRLCRDKELVLVGPYTITGCPWGNGWKTTIEPDKAAISGPGWDRVRDEPKGGDARGGGA